MKIKYEVYQREGAVASTPIVTYRGEPISAPREKRKYVGKKAKVEAIYRFMEHRFPDDVSTAEVDAFIQDNIFGRSGWIAYQRIFQTVANEKEISISKFVLLYYLEVEIDDRVNVDYDDSRLLYMLNQEVITNKRIQEYHGLINPIRSFSILYANY